MTTAAALVLNILPLPGWLLVVRPAFAVLAVLYWSTMTPFVAGLYRLADTWIYVSRGTGYWGPPMRLGAPAEITLLELVREA